MCRMKQALLTTLALGSVAIGLSCGQSSPPATSPQSALPAATATGQPTPTPAAVASYTDEQLLGMFTNEFNLPLMKALVELRKQDGRDNALIFYTVAGKLTPDAKTWSAQSNLITEVIERGWTPQSAALLPLIQAFQPAFQEIRKGAALDYAKNVGWGKGLDAPVPNFLTGQTSAKMLCVEGRYFESQNKHTEALDNYLAALTMGRDFGAPGALLIGNLISASIQNVAVTPIYDCAAKGNLDRSALERLFARLKVIESTQGSIAQSFQGEAESSRQIFTLIRENPDEARKLLAQMLAFSPKFTPDDVIKQVDRIDSENKRIWEVVLRQIQIPYVKRDPTALQQELAQALTGCHPFVTGGVPNYHEADTRFQVMKTKLLEAEYAAALALFKLDKGRYPQQLSELVATYFQALPADPFSGAEFRYMGTPDGSRYGLYSIGPDKTDNRAAVRYDSKNGTLSAGDIFY